MSLGCRPLVLSSQSGAEVIVVSAEITPSDVVASLPGVVLVTGFARLEPAAAALADNLGPHPDGLSCDHPGDTVVCRLMIRSMLLSAVRAWASTGAWPAPIADPFLARVDDDYLHAARLRARRRGLQTADALHLAVAWRAGCTAFWTDDARLAAASGGLAVDVIGAG